MPRISEQHIIIPMNESKDTGSAGIDFDSVYMGRLHSLSVCIPMGAITGNSILKVSCGATEGTKTTDIAFSYRFGGGDFKAASADILAAPVAVASTGLTMTAATFDHRLLVIEIDSDTVTDGQPWVTVSVDSTATAFNSAAIGIGYPRHQSKTAITVIK